MHRTRQVLKLGAWGLFTAGLAAGLASAQPPNPDPVPPTVPGQPRASTAKAIIVTINGSQQLRMSTNKPISSVINEKETVARVQPNAVDPKAIIIVGLQAGSSKVTLTDVDGFTESYDVLVQLDIDAIKSVIKLTFPTANVTPIAAGTNTIVLTGNVSHPEDIEPILRVARGVLGNAGQGATEVYNAMTVGGVRQVQLDVTIAQVNRSEARARNCNFIFNGTTASFGSILPGLVQQSATTTGIAGGGTGGAIIPQNIQAVPILSNGVAGGANAVFAVLPTNFSLLLQALREERLAKLLAEPKLVTMSGHPASFLVGGQQAILSPSSGINGPGVVLQDVGTSLVFLPIVLNNGKIFLEVQPTVRSVDNALGINTVFGFTPGFNVQQVTTRVMIEAGQTFALGGLIQTQTQADTLKVPVLGDLPFVGVLFSKINHLEQEQEMVVLVTPYLVDPMDCKQAPCKLPGMETRKPDDFELFLETIMEAPRGQRDVFVGKKYVPAWRSDPTADKYPCGGDRGCGNGCPHNPFGVNGGCGNGGCANGSCGANGHPANAAKKPTMDKNAVLPASATATPQNTGTQK